MTEAILSKTRSILTGDRQMPGTFHQVDEDDGTIRRHVYVDADTYEDLGRPEVITITIEPGDHLNP